MRRQSSIAQGAPSRSVRCVSWLPPFHSSLLYHISGPWSVRRTSCTSSGRIGVSGRNVISRSSRGTLRRGLSLGQSTDKTCADERKEEGFDDPRRHLGGFELEVLKDEGCRKWETISERGLNGCERKESSLSLSSTPMPNSRVYILSNAQYGALFLKRELPLPDTRPQ